MNLDELAFVNQQLSSMLRDGIPLEGSLRQLCSTMQRGPLRAELQLLEADLAKGVPLAKALESRKLPELYLRMLQLGARSNDLPGLLTLLADYYQNAGMIWMRLRGLMVYPAIVLVLTLAFSAWLAVLGHHMAVLLSTDLNLSLFFPFKRSHLAPANSQVYLWMPPILLAAVALPVIIAVIVPPLRRELQWRLPAFREASLARVASVMAMLLKAGCSLPDSLALLEHMERGTRAAKEMEQWKTRCADGRAKFSELAADSRIFPPMFIWLVAGAREDLAVGFARAAQAYQARAAYRTNMLLYAALPSSLLFLGLIVLTQVYPMGRLIFNLSQLIY